MSFYQQPKTDIAALLSLNTLNGETITADDFDIVAIRPTTVDDEVALNTKAMLRMTSSADFVGVVIAFYDRLNLGDLSNFQQLDTDRFLTLADPGVSVYDILDALRDAIGVQFTEDDLVETTTTDDGEGTSVVLTAKSTSPGWTGTTTIKLAGLPNIINAFYGRALPGF